jgi:hypothetical protein
LNGGGKRITFGMFSVGRPGSRGGAGFAIHQQITAHAEPGR